MPLYEVIVVGLGAVGSAATWHLARLGTKVLGIDRYRPPHEFGSSSGETRLTRVAVGEGVEYSPLALRSNEIWREIESTTGQTLYVQCGCLTITGHPNKSMVHGVNKFFDNIVASAERYNIPHEIFRSPDALRSRFPQFAVNETEVGFLDKAGGYLFLEACIRTQLRSAQECGAQLKFGEKVVIFNSSASGVTVTTDSGERYDAEKLLLAAGAWMPAFLPERLRQYFSVTRQFLHWFEIQTNPERFSKDCPVFIWEVNRRSILYGFPLVGELGAGLKVANEESEGIVDPDSVDRIVSEADKARMYETYIRPFLPDLGPRSIKTAVCLYTNAPGARFVIDTHPEHERMIFASPCSGHGFKHSAAIGEALADQLRNRPPKVDLSPFKLRRVSSHLGKMNALREGSGSTPQTEV
jgi:sarcosine oxidase